MMVKRLGDEGKQPVPIASLPEVMTGILEEFQALLLARATDFRDSHTVAVDTWDEFVSAVSTGWAQALHCGEPACEDDIKTITAATPALRPARGRAGDRDMRAVREPVGVWQAGDLRACLLIELDPSGARRDGWSRPDARITGRPARRQLRNGAHISDGNSAVLGRTDGPGLICAARPDKVPMLTARPDRSG